MDCRRRRDAEQVIAFYLEVGGVGSLRLTATSRDVFDWLISRDLTVLDMIYLNLL